MTADPSSLVLAEPWRKGTRSASGGCVEAARVVPVASRAVNTAAAPSDGAPDGRSPGQRAGEGSSSLI
jgi:hypothetical protein